MNTKLKDKVEKFEDIQEDLVFLVLKEGLPEGYKVVNASIVTKAVCKPGEARKNIVMVYQEDKEKGQVWSQRYNYNKVLRSIDRGLNVQAQRD